MFTSCWHFFASLDWEKLAKIFQALLTPAVGVATYFVYRAGIRIQNTQAALARQQAETNRQQYRLALFEKRIAVYNGAVGLIGDVLREANIDLPKLFQFLRNTSQSEFLFGEEIKEYVDELYSKGVDLHTNHIEVQAHHRPEDIRRNTELIMWFSEQYPVAKQKFLPYLNFREA